MGNIFSRFNLKSRPLIDSQQMTAIVGILADDVTVVAKWTELYYKLGVSMDIDSLRKGRNNRTLDCKDMLRDIIDKWRSEQGSKGTVEMLCNVLESMKCVYAAEKIQATLNINTARSTEPIFFGFERMSKNFTGRCKQIDEIENMLRDDFVKIIGMGGIGKTELAKKFANLHKEWNCIWLNAENAPILQTSVTELGEFLEIRDGSVEFKVLFCSCLQAIKKKNSFKVLVIVDNVDADYANARLVIDIIKDQENCFAIVTSRNVRVMGCAGDATINLNTLDNQEGFQLVRSSLEGESDQDIRSLCKQLDNFPLALQQAVAYIKQKQLGVFGKNFQILQYLEQYKKEQKKLLDFPLIELEQKYSKTTLITWQTSMEAIEGEEVVGKISIDLLNIIAYMEADRIPRTFIQQIYDQFGGSADQVIEALDLLIAYSLLTVKSEYISVHRLVQEVVRVQLVDNKVLIKLLNAIDTVNESREYSSEDASHALSVWRHFSQLHDKKLEREFMSKRINLMNRNLLGDNLYANFRGECVEIASRVLGEYDKQRLIIESRAASSLTSNSLVSIILLREKPGFTEPERVLKLKEVLDKQSKIEDVEESVLTAYCLALTLLMLKENEEAVELIQIIGNRDPQWNQLLVTVVGELTSTLISKGMCGEAVELGERALRSIVKQKGDEHPWATEIRDTIRVDISRWERSTIEELVRALEVVIRVFGQHSLEAYHKRIINRRNIRPNDG